MNRIVNMLTVPALALLAISWSCNAAAMSKAEINAGVEATLQAFYAQNPGHRELVSKAAAVLVFPHVTKAGVGVGGEHGEGALWVDGKIERYYNLNGASLGATIGVAQHSEVILFMTTEARKKFESSKGWTIGADAGVAVASKGAGVAYDSQTLGRPVLSFVMDEKGLIGDVSLAGSKITPVAS
jgi:lipid-binding SYLF domain-containing protein